MFDVTWTLNKDGLVKLNAQLASNIDERIGKVANDVVSDMDQHWSTTSPSLPGQAPAVVTGTLKNSTEARRWRIMLWKVRVRTAYALPLEYGTRRMRARPFLRPALMRAQQRLPQALRGVIEEAAK